MDNPHLLPKEVLGEKVDGDHAQEPGAQGEDKPVMSRVFINLRVLFVSLAPVSEEPHGGEVQDELGSCVIIAGQPDTEEWKGTQNTYRTRSR